ncbi:MAG: hypothetical protein R2710_07490 [Acidimicrobiales bacterium]
MLVRRLQWMAVGAAFSYASKVKTRRDIDRATTELGERMPESLHRVVNALPGDLPRVGGAAIVAKNNAATAAKATVAVTRAARKLSGTPRDVGDRVRSVRAEIGEGIERERRRLKADAIRETEGEGAALEALLDLRAVEAEPLPEVKPPIARGRRRHQPSLPAPPVARVQRTYLPPVTSWDRRAGNRSTDR